MPKSAKLSPSSPLEYMMLTPVDAASENRLSYAVFVAGSPKTSPSASPHELDTTDAPLVIAVSSDENRLVSKQSCAPTNWMCAPGAMACDDSTSSACSAYQPLAAQADSWSTDPGFTSVNCDA